MINSKLVEIELSKNGSNLYIFFGGIRGGLDIPKFEFYNSSKIIDENKIFFRDLDQCWYQNGILEIGETIYSISKYIQCKIKEINPKKIFFVGNSMGGYAAILFSCLIGQGEVIAFAPQTFIDPIIRHKYKDFRWKSEIYIMHKKTNLKKTILDLKPILLKLRKNLKISIFVSITNKLDYIHASYIKDISGITIYEFEESGHGIVKFLRDVGKLQSIMSGSYVHCVSKPPSIVLIN